MTTCQLCDSTDGVSSHEIAGLPSASLNLCTTCRGEIAKTDDLDVHHWRCLSDSMWTPDDNVQIMAWRLLKRLGAQGEGWAQDLFDTLYLEDDVLAKAQSETASDDDGVDTLKHVDSNGAVLEAGDTVVLIKDLNVKGAGFTAKRGTAVRNISLDPTNEEHIEGRVNGQQIVILTKFVKKS